MADLLEQTMPELPIEGFLLIQIFELFLYLIYRSVEEN